MADGRRIADGKRASRVFGGKRVLVAGGGGYFGHKLGNELDRQGAEVVLFDIFFGPFDKTTAYSQMEYIEVREL